MNLRRYESEIGLKYYQKSNNGKTEHQIGMCMHVMGGNHFYVPIPKNASQWCEDLFRDYHFIPHDFTKNQYILNKKPIIVLRDPVERWISGFTEFLYRQIKLTDRQSVLSMLNDINIFQDVVFDEHTRPQIDYIKDILNLEGIYFYLDYAFESNILRYMQTIDYKLVDTSNYKKHISLSDEFKKQVTLRLKEIVKNNIIYKNMLEEFYQEDYVLIDRIKNTNKFIRYQQ